MSAAAKKRPNDAATTHKKASKSKAPTSKAREEDETHGLSERCELACYHAACCGRGLPDSTHLVPNASDLNFQGVLTYLRSRPPIDYKLVPGHPDWSEDVHIAYGTNCMMDWDTYSTVVALMDRQNCGALAGAVFHLSLAAAAVAFEWDSVEGKRADGEGDAKRAIFEMVLLAGATIDEGIRKFAGSNLRDCGGGVHFSADYVHAVLKVCTAPPAARLERWPSVLAEISAAEAGAAQYAVIRARFLEICCEGKVEEAALDGFGS